MSSEQQAPDLINDDGVRPRGGILSKILRSLLCLAVVAAGVAGALWMMETSPKAKPRKASRNAALVAVAPAAYGPAATTVSAMGTVVPGREIELRPHVAGEIVETSAQLAPGETFRRGEVLLKIDPADYRLAERQLDSSLSKAAAELQIEEGNQIVAIREYELLGEDVSEEEKALMLRRPQLEKLRAALDAAKASLEKARLDLSRTTVQAPFNAVVLSRSVDVGSRVTESTTLASLVGTDEYWVRVSVPVDRLRWISIPGRNAGEGASVKIFDRSAWGEGRYRRGRVLRIEAGLEEEGRMARLIVGVKDPLGVEPESENEPRLLIGSYVRVEIEGTGLPSALAVDRKHIRDGENLWVMDGGGRLDIRKAAIAFKDRDSVLVTGGIEEGESLVVSDLPSAVQGMPLRLPEGSEEVARAEEETGR